MIKHSFVSEQFFKSTINDTYKVILIKLFLSNQSKFLEVRKTGSKHGYNLPTSPVVLLNALGFLGFKVVPACCWTSKFFILLIFINQHLLFFHDLPR